MVCFIHISPLFNLVVGQTVRLASPGTTLLRSAAPGQPGKQIFLQRPGSNQPGQIVTLVKTSQGMTVASVIRIPSPEIVSDSLH